MHIFIKNKSLPLFPNHDIFASTFSSAPGLLPVPGGSGRPGHRLNKTTSLKYQENPGVVFFLGLFAPLNLKGRVNRGRKGAQIHTI